MTRRGRQHDQQLVTTPVLTTVHVTISLPTYILRGFAHQPLDGGQPRDSHGGSSLGGDSFGRPSFNPLVGSFGWPTFDPQMFIPTWYQPLVVQLVT
jgi:hypothetical protein